MKVIAFNGSPHKNGTVAQGIEVLGGELEAAGVELEIVQVGAALIHGCVGCYSCRKTGDCVFNDDLVNESRHKAGEADGIILASPTYYGSIAGTYKSFLDRFFFAGSKLKYKAGACVVSVRRTGGISVYHQLNNYLNLGGLITIPDFYWPVIHGSNAEETTQDSEGMQCMRQAGRNMAWLIKSLAAAREAVPLPQEEDRVFTNFIRR
jgi:multimeric flavodoxin WrbA